MRILILSICCYSAAIYAETPAVVSTLLHQEVISHTQQKPMELSLSPKVTQKIADIDPASHQAINTLLQDRLRLMNQDLAKRVHQHELVSDHHADITLVGIHGYRGLSAVFFMQHRLVSRHMHDYLPGHQWQIVAIDSDSVHLDNAHTHQHTVLYLDYYEDR